MKKFKKYLIIIILLLVTNSIIKSDLIFLLSIVALGLFIYFDIKNKPKTIKRESYGKVSYKKVDKIDLEVLDVIVFNEFEEIESTIQKLYDGNDKVKITISDFDKNKYVINSKVALDNVKSKSYVVKFDEYIDFKYVNRFLHSNLNTCIISNIDMLKYEVIDNLNINFIKVKLNDGTYINSFDDVKLYDYGKFVCKLDRENYLNFKRIYEKKNDIYLKKNYDEFIKELKENDKLLSFVEGLYYGESKRNNNKYRIILDEKCEKFYSCEIDEYAKEFTSLNSIRTILILTSFSKCYKDIFLDMITLEIK